MNARRLLGVFLECAGPGVLARHAQARYAADEQDEARALWSGRLAVLQSTRQELIALLGPPDRSDGRHMAYDLGTRSAYLYELRFSEAGRFTGAGFIRQGVRPPAPELEHRASLSGRLAEIGATANEVRAWLGTPQHETGWWPIESWEYEDGLIIEFRHEMVESS